MAGYANADEHCDVDLHDNQNAYYDRNEDGYSNVYANLNPHGGTADLAAHLQVYARANSALHTNI